MLIKSTLTKETYAMIIAALLRALGPMFKKKFGSGRDEVGRQAGGSADTRPL